MNKILSLTANQQNLGAILDKCYTKISELFGSGLEHISNEIQIFSQQHHFLYTSKKSQCSHNINIEL